MFTPTPQFPDFTISDPAGDFRAAQRIEQYRLGAEALYLPVGLRWHYIPLSAVEKAEKAHRVISAGHCVTVREERPALRLETRGGPVLLNLEKAASLPRLLEALGK